MELLQQTCLDIITILYLHTEVIIIFKIISTRDSNDRTNYPNTLVLLNTLLTVCLQNFFRKLSFKLGRLYMRTHMRFRSTQFTNAGLLNRNVI